MKVLRVAAWVGIGVMAGASAFAFFVCTAPPMGILMRIGVSGEMTGSAIATALGGVVATGILFLWVSGRVFRGAMLMQD